MDKENPIEIFGEWYGEAVKSGIFEPDAMCLATCTKDGYPSNRMVLLKGFGEDGFVFYTNLESRKGGELAQNPNVALCIYYKELERQIRIEGVAKSVSDEEADEYFKSRALKSKIGAWVSKQSRPMDNPKELINEFSRQVVKMAKGEVQRPPFWSGFKVVPKSIEFWQKGEFRLHTRKKFIRNGDRWNKELLYP